MNGRESFFIAQILPFSQLFNLTQQTSVLSTSPLTKQEIITLIIKFFLLLKSFFKSVIIIIGSQMKFTQCHRGTSILFSLDLCCKFSCKLNRQAVALSLWPSWALKELKDTRLEQKVLASSHPIGLRDRCVRLNRCGNARVCKIRWMSPMENRMDIVHWT